jgi:uncharacterized protein (DUF2267 family)
MHYEDFVDQVRKRAGLQNNQQAEIAVRITLETLGERLHRTEREKLAAQLPNRLKEYLGSRPGHDFFLLEEFYNRVAARSGIRYPNAVEQALAVVDVLKEAISPGELRDLLAGLSEEYGELFGVREVGPLSPTSV